MGLDTGAAVTVILKEIWQKDLRTVPLKKSNVTLRTSSGHSKPVIGETAVQIKYSAQEIDRRILVTKGKGVLSWEEIGPRLKCWKTANQPKPKLENTVQQY